MATPATARGGRTGRRVTGGASCREARPPARNPRQHQSARRPPRPFVRCQARQRAYRVSLAAARRCSSMAPRLRSAGASFDALPEPVFRVLFLALPVDERARAACVCRSWRAFLADPSLWQVLDLSPAGGVAAARVTENLVRGAVARAAGQLRTLSINDDPDWLHIAFLVELIESDGAELQQVNAGVWLSTARCRTCLPRRRGCRFSTVASWTSARRCSLSCARSHHMPLCESTSLLSACKILKVLKFSP